MSKKRIARWQSVRGAYWAELYEDPTYGFTYRGNDCGGVLPAETIEQAIEEMWVKVKAGYFQPDASKTLMKRTR